MFWPPAAETRPPLEQWWNNIANGTKAAGFGTLTVLLIVLVGLTARSRTHELQEPQHFHFPQPYQNPTRKPPVGGSGTETAQTYPTQVGGQPPPARSISPPLVLMPQQPIPQPIPPPRDSGGVGNQNDSSMNQSQPVVGVTQRQMDTDNMITGSYTSGKQAYVIANTGFSGTDPAGAAASIRGAANFIRQYASWGLTDQQHQSQYAADAEELDRCASELESKIALQ